MVPRRLHVTNDRMDWGQAPAKLGVCVVSEILRKRADGLTSGLCEALGGRGGVINGLVGMEGNGPALGTLAEQCRHKSRPHRRLIESYDLG